VGRRALGKTGTTRPQRRRLSSLSSLAPGRVAQGETRRGKAPSRKVPQGVGVTRQARQASVSTETEKW